MLQSSVVSNTIVLHVFCQSQALRRNEIRMAVKVSVT